MGHAPSSSSAATVRKWSGPSLTHLPDALIQSVCHSLSAREILSLARASKQMMHAIDTPFAWLHSPLSILMDRLRSPQLSPKRSCLYARAPVLLMCTRLHPFGGAGELLNDRGVLESEFLSGPPRIHALDLSSDANPSAHWIPLLTHPSCAALRSLRLYSSEKTGDVPTVALGAIRSLAHLHTLSVFPNDASADNVDWSMLAQMPRLTSLEMCDAEGFAVKSQLPSIVRCNHLRELRLARFAQPAIELFEVVAPLSQLRLLWLGRGCSNIEPVLHLSSRFQSACARMQSLEDLRFSASQMMRQALPYLVECKSLRSLSLQRDINMVGQEAAAVYCSPQLAFVLSVLPACVFSLRVVVHSSVPPDRAAGQVKSFEEMFSACCAIEFANQAKSNEPQPAASVSARLRTVIELPSH